MNALTPAQARAQYRDGLISPTAGVAPGYAQANLLAVPREHAFDFLLYAQRNPKPCPVLGVLEAGQYSSELLVDGDIRTDIPAYNIYRDGALSETVASVEREWTEDMVGFLIGCSFTFETALLEAGVPIAHIDQGRNVPMYRTSLETTRAGVFGGPLVVSMRPIPASQVADAVRVTSRYPAVHGAPVHVGDPAAIGIADLDAPDFGDAVDIAEGEIPVFWACGVTPQAAVMASGIEFAIAHKPGHMLITDIRDSAYLVP